ncbi:hypothetical protein [Mesomycoplasma ovipneumoniae]
MKKACLCELKLHFRVKNEYYKARRKNKYSFCLAEYFIRIKQHLDKGTLKCRCSCAIEFINRIKGSTNMLPLMAHYFRAAKFLIRVKPNHKF